MNYIKGFILSTLICMPLAIFAAEKPIQAITIFGDSLSDNGNTTHLLKSLRQDESPAYLVEPLKVYVTHKMEEFADDYGIPQIILDGGLAIVQNFFDHDLAPKLANLISKIKKVPVIPGEPYWQNRFSNGRVWFEYLAPMLSIDRDDKNYTNLAFGGSWAATYDYQLTFWNFIKHPLLTLENLVVGKLIPPSLGLTVQAYLLKNEKLDNRTLYFVLTGGNDYINAFRFGSNYDDQEMFEYVSNVVDSIDYSVNKLMSAGARKVVILGLPNIGVSPKFQGTYEGELLARATTLHNNFLKTKIEVWQMDYPQGIFIYLDLDTYLNKALTNPAEYGFTNTKDPCIDVKFTFDKNREESPFPNNYVLNYAEDIAYRGNLLAAGERNYNMCDNPKEYLFWDEIHPSTKVHLLLALEICQALKAQGFKANCVMP